MQRAKHKVFIASQPKAGTYLVSEIVRRLGYHHTYLHFDRKYLDPYDPTDMQNSLQMYLSNRIKIPLKNSVKLIRPGELAVGHIPYNSKTGKILSEFKVIYLSRELRSALFSELKFGVSTKRIKTPSKSDLSDPKQAMLMFLGKYGRNSITRARNMSNWKTVEHVPHLRFEDTINHAEDVLEVIGSYLDESNEAIDNKMLELVLGARTLTKSDSSLKFEDFWSAEAEKLFIQLGGKQANDAMGYASAQ